MPPWAGDTRPRRRPPNRICCQHVEGTDVPEFPVNPTRLDPYKGFKFRVMWDSRYVLGVDSVSALTRTTEVVAHREGGDPSQSHLSPGLTSYAPIVLSRGRTQDTAFEQWANRVWSLNETVEVALADFRKDIILDLFNEAGQKVLSWNVFRCWPSEYIALSNLNSGDSSVVIESLRLENEGWERDPAVVEPVEPTAD
jgi:phage tail-like protein